MDRLVDREVGDSVFVNVKGNCVVVRWGVHALESSIVS